MITVEVFASSSDGNCYRLTSGTHQLLLEAGLRFSKLKAAINYQLGYFDGCLITHEHNDHSQSVQQLILGGVDVYMSNGTAMALGERAKGAKIVKPDKAFMVAGYWSVKPLLAYHDAAEPLAYMICDRNDVLLFATDTYVLPYKFNVLNQIMIECNYLPELLDEHIREGKINYKQAHRLLHSHMSLDSVLSFLKQNKEAVSYCRQIYLLHGSPNNGNPTVFKDVVQKFTGKPVVVCGP